MAKEKKAAESPWQYESTTVPKTRSVPEMSKVAAAFQHLKLTGVDSYEEFTLKAGAILQLNGIKTDNFKDYDDEVFNLYSLAATGEAQRLMLSTESRTNRKASLLIPILDSEYGATSAAVQMSIQQKLRNLTYTGDLKLYLTEFELTNRRLAGSYKLDFNTLLHLLKNELVAEHQLNLRFASANANGNISNVIAELMAIAQELTIHKSKNATAMVTYTPPATTQHSDITKHLSTLPCWYCKKQNHSVNNCFNLVKDRDARPPMGYPTVHAMMSAPVDHRDRRNKRPTPTTPTAKKALTAPASTTLTLSGADLDEYLSLRASAGSNVTAYPAFAYKSATPNFPLEEDQIVINPDSMANIHIIGGDKSRFSSYKEIKTPIAGVADAFAVGIGTIAFTIVDKKSQASTTVEILVHHLPSYQGLLYSTNIFTQEGGKFIQSKTGDILIMSNGTTINVGRDRNNLPYFVSWYYCETSCNY